MRKLCQFSLRWHQQFYKSPNFAGHWQCLDHFQPIRHYRKGSASGRNQTIRNHDVPRPQIPFPNNSRIDGSISSGPRILPGPLIVKEYEQHGNDATTIQQEQPHPVQLEAQRVKARLEQLEKELAILKQGPFGPQSEFMQSLPVDQRDQLLKALEEEGVDLQDDLNFIDDDELSLDFLDEETDQARSSVQTSAPKKSLQVSLRIPAQDKAYVRQFNRCLKTAEDRSDDAQSAFVLWKWYLRCQQKVPNFSKVISEDVWQFLWSSLSHFNQRTRYIVVLAKDILAGGGSLKPEQWLEYIQALHVQGDLATALSVWENKKDDLGGNPNVAVSFWTAGTTILAVLGRPKKAEELAFECLESLDNFQPQLLVPVIAAWADSRDPRALDSAWACYLNLRAKMGGKVDLELLDDISNIFLSRGHHRLALAVFKDMVVGDADKRFDSISVWKRTIEQLEDLQQKSIDADQINQISLTALTVFPKSFQNKFFYASWIKRLIGSGHVEAAASVVDLMYEREIKPDAKHMNGIIGAWFRSSSQKNHEKAERMAWTMIGRRIQMVQARSQKDHASGEGGPKPRVFTIKESDGVIRHIDLRRPTPSANVETFSLLLMYYTTRSNLDKAEQLTQTMTTMAQIKPNSFILNHWLYSSLRQGDLQALWMRYSDFKHEIAMDLETFAALWDASKVNNDRTRAAYSLDFPSSRELFREMQLWLNNLSEKKRSTAKEEFSNDLFEQIIRCFCLAGDLPGIFTALQGVRQNFDMLPHEDIAQMVVFKAAQLAIPANEGPNRISIRRRKTKQQQMHRDLMDAFTSLTENMAVQAVTDAETPHYSSHPEGSDHVDFSTSFLSGQITSADTSDPESSVTQAIRFKALASFISMLHARSVGDRENVFADFKTACDDMSVSINEEELNELVSGGQSRL